MHIFKCKVTEDVVMSDAYPVVEVFGGFVFEVKSEYVKKGGENYGIEAEEGEVDDQTKEVNNIIDGFELKETKFDTLKLMQAQISKYLKTIMPFVKEEGAEKLAAFKKEATEFVKFLSPKFKELQFYTG